MTRTSGREVATAVLASGLLLGSGASTDVGAVPATFYTVTPCRVFDSRTPAQSPALASGVERIFAVGGTCGIPAGASAVAFNIAVTEPTAPGYLKLYAAGEAVNIPAVNFVAGQTRANNGIVRLSASGQVAAVPILASPGTVHVVLDASGYFLEDEPPVAVDDAATVSEDASATAIDVLANDTDADGGARSVGSVTQPANGTVVITGGGTGLTYAPDPDYCNFPPGGAPDTFTYTLSPGTSTATVSVTVDCVNDAPELDGAGTVAFTEGGGPVPVAPALTVADVDDTSLESATVTITNLLDAGAETLGATTAGTGITAVYVAPTLTLTGTDTVASYEAVLRSVTYDNASESPSATTRALALVASDGSLASLAELAAVTISPTNDAPVLTAGGGAPSFTEDGPAVAVDPALAVADVDSPNLGSATVTLTNLLDAGAETLAASTAGTTIVASYVAPTLTLSGVDTLAHYQAVLRSVTYANASQNPTTTPRSVAFVVNDGALGSNTATKLVAVVAVDDAPGLARGGGSPVFTEDGPGVTVDPGLVATDVDDTSLESGTVTITNLLDAGAEALGATTAGTAIVASYVAPTLSLTGTDTVAHYQAVLRSVAYANASQNPSAVPRVVAFVANDGDAGSNVVTTTVAIVATDDAPVLTTGGGSPTFTEGGAPVAVDPGLVVADPDSPNLDSATVTVTNLLDAGAETLAADTSGTSITAVYAAPTLTLTGADTQAHYQAVLRAVTYSNSSDEPTTTARVVSFVVEAGSLSSNTVTTSVTVQPVDDAPVLTAGGGSPTFTEDGPAMAVDPGLVATDVDDVNLESASVTIVNLLDAGVEALGATTGGTAIVASYVAPVLTLSGTDTVARYQAVLRSVTYSNASQNPTTTPRTIRFVAHDGTNPGNTVSTLVSVVPVNDGPLLGGTGTATFTEDAGAVAVAPALTAVDVDGTTLASAAVTITNVSDVGAEVLLADTSGTSIVAAYSAPTLTLTGVDTVAAYQAVLRTVGYLNNSQNPSPASRIVSFAASDGTDVGNTALATVAVVPVNDPPMLPTDPVAYATAGNTQLHVAGDTLPGVASITDAQSVLAKAGASDPDSPISVVAVLAGTSTNGGQFAIDTDGSFTYVPAPGFTGPDSFPYDVTDGSSTVTGTVNVSVGTVVWYVRDVVDALNPAAGDGRSTDAFETLAAAQTASDNNHVIFVFAGNTATTPLAGGVALKNGQKLLGEGVGLTVAPFGTLVPAGAQPRVRNTTGDAVSVPATSGSRTNVEVRGLDLEASGNAIDVTATGANAVGVTLSANTIRGAGLEGIDLNAGSTGTFTAVVQDNMIVAAGNGFDARATSGSLRVDFSRNAVAAGGLGGAAVFVGGSGTGSAVVTGFGANSVSGSALGAGVVIATATFDAVPGALPLEPVGGGITTIGTPGDGVGGAGLTLSNVAGALDFADLDVFSDSGAALVVSGTGAYTGAAGTQVTVADDVATLRATSGPAVDVANATLRLVAAGLTSTNSPTTGVSLVNVADGAGVQARLQAPASAAITGAVGTAFNVSGGNAGVSYAGSITNTAGRSVSIAGWSGDDLGDDLELTGTINDTGTGITVSGNGGPRAITLGGTLNLQPVAGNAGFAASGNTNLGGLRITDASNTIDTTGAPALTVTDTTIGSGGLHFVRLSANGGVGGIVLTNTGTLAGLGVSGAGSAGSGGTIQNMTGNGISLTNTREISLAHMSIHDNHGSGVSGDDVTDFSISDSTVTANGDTANGTEAGLRFQELLGDCAITNTTVSGSSEDNVRITPASGVLTNLAISGSTIGPNSATTGGNGVALIGSGTASATVNVTASSFVSNRGAGFLSSFSGSGGQTVVVDGNVFRDNGKGVSLASNGTAGLNLTVTNNLEVVRSASSAIELLASADTPSTTQVTGRISGNVVGNGNPDSGSHDWHGIAVDLRGDERTIVSVTSNTVRHVDLMGIFLTDADFGANPGPPSDSDLTLRDNTVRDVDDNSGFTCGAPWGTVVDFRHTTVGCLDMANNESAASPAVCPDEAHFRVRQRNTSTLQMERLGDGDGTPNELLTDPTVIRVGVEAQNDPGSTANVLFDLGFTEAANQTCVKP